MNKLNNVFIMFVSLFIVVSGVCLSGCEKELQETESNWIEDTFSMMTNEQKIGQLFCLTVDPFQYFMYPYYQSNINTLIGKYKPGGIFFIANLDTVKLEIRNEFNGNKLHDELIEMQKHSVIPFMAAANFESGAWYWDKQATHFPFPLALGATRSREFAYRQGKITAVEAKAQGINWIFSPFINISIDPDNTFLQMQSLGNDPELTGELGARYIMGCQEAGIAACLKYFPTEKYSSLLTMSPEEIDPSQLEAFKAGIDAGVMSIMGSPLSVTGPDTTKQTQYSKQMITDLLRNNLGFEGIFICDLITTNTSNDLNSGINIIQETVKAGCDMFIIPETFDANIPLIDLLLNEGQSGTLDMTAVSESVQRILKVKNRLNLKLVKSELSLRAMAGIGLPEYHHTSQEISVQCVTLLKNEQNIIPVDYNENSIVSIVFLDENSPHFATLYGEKFEKFNDTIKQINIFGTLDKRIHYEARRRAAEVDIVICSFFTKPDNDDPTSSLSPGLENLFKQITAVNDNVIVVSFYNPYLINHLPEVQGYIITYSPFEHSMDSAVNVIFGKSDAHGKLPIHISEKFMMGFGLSLSGEEEVSE